MEGAPLEERRPLQATPARPFPGAGPLSISPFLYRYAKTGACAGKLLFGAGSFFDDCGWARLCGRIPLDSLSGFGHSFGNCGCSRFWGRKPEIVFRCFETLRQPENTENDSTEIAGRMAQTSVRYLCLAIFFFMAIAIAFLPFSPKGSSPAAACRKSAVIRVCMKKAGGSGESSRGRKVWREGGLFQEAPSLQGLFLLTRTAPAA